MSSTVWFLDVHTYLAIVSLSMYRSPQLMFLAEPDARFSAILVRVSLLSDICADVWLVRFE